MNCFWVQLQNKSVRLCFLSGLSYPNQYTSALEKRTKTDKNMSVRRFNWNSQKVQAILNTLKARSQSRATAEQKTQQDWSRRK